MDVIILCKDCGEQFSNGKSNDKIDRIKELSKMSKNLLIKFSECMGVCPTGKICTIRLRDSDSNSMKKTSLLPKEICVFLSINNEYSIS